MGQSLDAFLSVFDTWRTGSQLIYMTHLASLSSQTWCHFLSWTLVFLVAVTNGAFTGILGEFSAGCPGKEGTCFDNDMQMAAGACAALATAQQTKGFQLWCHLSPMHLISTFKVRKLYEIKRVPMKGSWALEWHCKRPGTQCYKRACTWNSVSLTHLMVVWIIYEDN